MMETKSTNQSNLNPNFPNHDVAHFLEILQGVKKKVFSNATGTTITNVQKLHVVLTDHIMWKKKKINEIVAIMETEKSLTGNLLVYAYVMMHADCATILLLPPPPLLLLLLNPQAFPAHPTPPHPSPNPTHPVDTIAYLTHYFTSIHGGQRGGRVPMLVEFHKAVRVITWRLGNEERN